MTIDYVTYKAPVTLLFKEVEIILSERTGIRRDDIRLVLDEFFYLVFEALRRGHNIRLAHVGFFNVVRTHPRVTWAADGKLAFIPSIRQIGFRLARSVRLKTFEYFTAGTEPTPREAYGQLVKPVHLQYALTVAEKRLSRKMKLDLEDFAFLQAVVNELKEKALEASAPSEDEAEDTEDEDDGEEED